MARYPKEVVSQMYFIVLELYFNIMESIGLLVPSKFMALCLEHDRALCHEKKEHQALFCMVECVVICYTNTRS